MSGDYDSEPVRGLPEILPAGETMLWQGSPGWKNIALRTMHVKAATIYFALLLAWYFGTTLASRGDIWSVLVSTSKLALAAAFAIALLASFSWVVGRTTIYSITNRRVVFRCGIALPMMLNIPFQRIASADFKAYRDGSGDISLSLTRENRMSYLALWPHARPWRINHAQPLLRGIPQAAVAAQLLSRALAAEASLPAQPLPETGWETATSGASRPPAAAMA